MKALHTLAAAIAAMFLIIGALPALATHEDPNVEHEFADNAFLQRWERLDRPVTEVGVNRTFWWGPGPYTEGMMEDYQDTPGGERLVQYFDKSRMEINDPNAASDDLWYVTNGLLVVEMIEGRMQVGDAAFEDAAPADVPVVGDPDSPFAPTYAALAQRLGDDPLPDGSLVTNRVDQDGNVMEEPELADYEIAVTNYVVETNHMIAEPFWEIMTTIGPVWENGEIVDGQIFPDPYYATGRPIAEPYWSTANVAGVETDVLLQCFERRCLTYTPGNEIGFRVEAGNVGQHYYRWRYGDGGGGQTEIVNIHFVALEDNGQGGMLIGCGDSLIPVNVEIEASDDVATTVQRALAAQLGQDDEFYGESGLYNALYQSNLSVDSVVMSGAEATVAISGEMLTGGTCDEPRFVEQVRQTVLAVDGVDTAVITVNGTPLEELFGGSGQ